MNIDQLRELSDVVTAVSIAADHVDRLVQVCDEYSDELKEVLGEIRFDQLYASLTDVNSVIEESSRKFLIGKCDL